MKANIIFPVVIVMAFVAPYLSSGKGIPFFNSHPFCFVENNGQIKDQYGCLRDDIQFALNGNGINIFIGNGQLHYQFCKTEVCQPERSYSFRKHSANVQHYTETYRMDVELIGANAYANIITEEQQGYSEIYYTTGCPENGIQANTYKKITYKNIYPHIDWVIVLTGNKLEHEFVVNAGGQVSDIQLKYSGQNSITIDANGNVVAITPLGTIKELAPICYSSDGSRVSSGFRLNNNIVSYGVNDYKGALVIDPVLEWGTYYGIDSSGTNFSEIKCDSSANIYGVGGTSSAAIGSIATLGSYEATMLSGGAAFIVKFDSSGHRLWGTYYGGSNGAEAVGLAYDRMGYLYVLGNTTSTDSIATPGSDQPVCYGCTTGGLNGFLAKFNTSGIRIWATYMGGIGTTIFSSVSCDQNGHIFVSGATEDTAHLATPGSFKPFKDGPFGDHYGSRDFILIMFNSDGVKKWGTYYGGRFDDFDGINSSFGNYVYLSGTTYSDTGIASLGAYQTNLTGISDAFLAKFDTLGNRIWGTYYGGETQEIMGGIVCSKKGSVYLLGITGSDTGIATSGCFQPVRGGSFDAFLTKFNAITGYPIWGTYFGGAGDERTGSSKITTDDSDNVYIVGCTTSATGMASAGAWQTTNGGGANDVFLAKFNSSGGRDWSTYYGGSGNDMGWGCAFDGKGVYVCGYTSSSDSIATPGSFLDTGGGLTWYYQGFLSKFIDTSSCYLSSSPILIRVGDTLKTTISYISYQWFLNGTPIAGATNSTYIVMANGLYTLSVRDSNNCKGTSVADSVLLGITNLHEQSITIAPNPTAGEVRVIGFSPTRIQVFDIYSKLIKEANQTKLISISDLPAGVYFFQLIDEQNVCIFRDKVIKN